MELTKEKCYDALDRMIYACASVFFRYQGKKAKFRCIRRHTGRNLEYQVYNGDYKALMTIDRLIKEHFELIEHINTLERENNVLKKALDKACEQLADFDKFLHEEGYDADENWTKEEWKEVLMKDETD